MWQRQYLTATVHFIELLTGKAKGSDNDVQQVRPE
jgi:hypothetical protein